MSVNKATQDSFKAIARRIFDSMIEFTGEAYVEPVNHDPLTGDPTNDTKVPVRMYGSTVRDIEGLDQEVRIGDRVFYFVVDEIEVRPVEKGKIEFEGEQYEVYRVELDGAFAVYKCYTRRT